MFLYIEVVIPPSQWSKPTLAAWLILQGMVTLSVHITHIQFLTLLFPSGLEQKLILGLLGPLAFASSFLSFVDLSDVPAVVDLGEAVRDTCDSSLTLLYTLAIFGWSLTLNRERAWKSEGGTVAFGIVALVLGTCGTALNFLESKSSFLKYRLAISSSFVFEKIYSLIHFFFLVREERLKWLSGVVDCILLWQSWVSLWWWVGSGMYDGEVADLTKRIKKAERLENRRLAKLGLLKNSTTAGGEDTVVGVGSSLRGISGAVRRRITGSGSRRGSNATAQQPEEIELQTFNNNATTTSPLSSTPLSSSPPPSTITSTPIINSLHPIPAFFITPILSLFSPFLNRLKKAHETTIKAKAAEIPLPHNLERTREAKTWGIRSLINRGRRDLDERRAEAGYGQGGLTRGGEVTGGEVRIEGRRAGFEIDGAVQLEDEDEDNEGEDETQWVDENVVSSDRRKEEVQNNTSWGLKNLIRRWRLKDVQTY